MAHFRYAVKKGGTFNRLDVRFTVQLVSTMPAEAPAQFRTSRTAFSLEPRSLQELRFEQGY